jgi:hypothetical protein
MVLFQPKRELRVSLFVKSASSRSQADDIFLSLDGPNIADVCTLGSMLDGTPRVLPGSFVRWMLLKQIGPESSEEKSRGINVWAWELMSHFTYC